MATLISDIHTKQHENKFTMKNSIPEHEEVGRFKPLTES